MKNNAFRVIAVIALVLSVAGLSIGFAAYSETLKITSSATYQITNENAHDFKVAFTTGVNGNTFSPFDYSEDSTFAVIDSDEDGENYGEITINPPMPGSISPYCGYGSSTDNCGSHSVDGDDATVADTRVSDIHATFNARDRQVVYLIPYANYGFVDAYLKNVKFNGTKTCTASENSELSQEKVQSICNEINMSFTILGNGYTTTTNDITTNNKLNSGDGKFAKLELSISGDAPLTTEQIQVSFPEIELNFSSSN